MRTFRLFGGETVEIRKSALRLKDEARDPEDDEDEEMFPGPAVREFDVADLGGRGPDAIVPESEEEMDALAARLGSFSTDASNRYAVDGTEVSSRHRDLNPFMRDPGSAYVGGQDLEASRQAYDGVMSATPYEEPVDETRTDVTRRPVRVGENYIMPSQSGIAPATRMENFSVSKNAKPLAKRGKGLFSSVVFDSDGGTSTSR